jgi:predicted metal-dependent hydrolase
MESRFNPSVNEVVTLDVRGVPVTLHIRRSKRARIPRIRALVDKLEVVVPFRARGPVAERLVHQHEDWVLAHHLSLQSRQVRVSEGAVWFEGTRYLFVASDTAVEWDEDKGVVRGKNLKAVAEWVWSESKARLANAVDKWAPVMGVKPKQVRFRKQRTVWGTCNSAGNLSLNMRLVMAPPEALEYVVVHELAHLLHPNHSRAFWECVERFYPDYRVSEKWLKDHYADLRGSLAGL